MTFSKLGIDKYDKKVQNYYRTVILLKEEKSCEDYYRQ